MELGFPSSAPVATRRQGGMVAKDSAQKSGHQGFQTSGHFRQCSAAPEASSFSETLHQGGIFAVSYPAKVLQGDHIALKCKAFVPGAEASMEMLKSLEVNQQPYSNLYSCIKELPCELMRDLPNKLRLANAINQDLNTYGDLEDIKADRLNRMDDRLSNVLLASGNAGLDMTNQATADDQGIGVNSCHLNFATAIKQNLEPDLNTVISTLKACDSPDLLHEGRKVHALILEKGFMLNSYLGSFLIDMYRKCGSFNDALIFFETLPEQCTITWNALISEYVLQG